MLAKGSSSSPCGSSLCEGEHLDISYSKYVEACQAQKCTYRIAGGSSTTEYVSQVSISVVLATCYACF